MADDRDAAPVRHDGGGHDPALAEADGEQVQPRRGARRDRDRQGHDDLRVRPSRRAGDRRRRGRHAAGRRADRTHRRRRAERQRGRDSSRRRAAAVPPPSAASAPAAAGTRRRRLSAGRCLGAGREPPEPRAGASRPRRWRGGSPARAASICTRSSGSGPGGRIVKADVQAASDRGAAPVSPSTPHCAVSARRELDADTNAPATASSHEQPATAKGETTASGAVAHAADDRAADGRVEGDDPRLHAADRRRHGSVRRAARAAESAVPAAKRPTYNDMVVKACALALREHPRANGSYRDGALRAALARERRRRRGRPRRAGRADRVRRRHQVARRDRARDARPGRACRARARSRRRSSAAARSPSRTSVCTACSSFSAIINPPQAAILSVGALAPRAVVRDGEIVPRNTMTAHARVRPPHPLRRRRRPVPRSDS